MSRSVVLGNVRRALRHHSKVPRPPDICASSRIDDPVPCFRRELEAIGGILLDGRRSEAIPGLFSDVLRSAGATRIFWEAEEIFAQHPLPYRLRDPMAFKSGQLVFSSHRHCRVDFPLVLHSRPYSRELLESVELSAGLAQWGIAETGTVIHQTRAPGGRLLSVMPPAHIAVLSAKRLVMETTDFFRQFAPHAGSVTTMITGPSQTADIEKVLVRGVHGPRMWFVLLTE